MDSRKWEASYYWKTGTPRAHKDQGPLTCGLPIWGLTQWQSHFESLNCPWVTSMLFKQDPWQAPALATILFFFHKGAWAITLSVLKSTFELKLLEWSASVSSRAGIHVAGSCVGTWAFLCLEALTSSLSLISPNLPGHFQIPMHFSMLFPLLKIHFPGIAPLSGHIIEFCLFVCFMVSLFH